ncbi:hypothetical protein J2Z23_000660 [Lederbergia galactosidilyticus]|nr:hypothetical protein [Lederbergia galactosidilytica]
MTGKVHFYLFIQRSGIGASLEKVEIENHPRVLLLKIFDE